MKQRHIPNDYKSREYKDANAIIYFKEINNVFYAMGYKGKRSKPDFHFKFKTQQNLETYINDYLKRLMHYEQSKLERKEKRLNFIHSLKEGDILYSSWGYEQTNIDFYQVVIVVSNKTVKIRKIRSEDVECEGYGAMTGKCIAVKDDFYDDEIMLKKVKPGNYISLESYSSAHLWDGLPKRYSWYG